MKFWGKKKNKKKPEPFCKNCRLFDPANKLCAVFILYEGQKVRLPVEPEDKCFFENEFVALNEKGEKETFKPEVKQVRMWVEDENGQVTDGNGTVKIEYPPDFFGQLE